MRSSSRKRGEGSVKPPRIWPKARDSAEQMWAARATMQQHFTKEEKFPNGGRNSFRTPTTQTTMLSYWKQHFRFNRIDETTNRGRLLKMLTKVNTYKKGKKNPRKYKLISRASRFEPKAVLNHIWHFGASRASEISTWAHLLRMLTEFKLWS